MFKETLHILHGVFLWRMLRLKYAIDYKKVVLVPVNEIRDLDYYALAHLEDYMERKYAKEAIVLYEGKDTYHLAEEVLAEYGSGGNKVRLCPCDRKTIETIYDYYSFHKFFDNIVFTYAFRPEDNLLRKVLSETQVNEEDAVCLGLYRLRMVLPLRKKDKRIETCSTISL